MPPSTAPSPLSSSTPIRTPGSIMTAAFRTARSCAARSHEGLIERETVDPDRHSHRSAGRLRHRDHRRGRYRCTSAHPASRRRIKERVGEDKAYLTFDIDCLDPAFAPGTGTPVAGGLSSREALGDPARARIDRLRRRRRRRGCARLRSCRYHRGRCLHGGDVLPRPPRRAPTRRRQLTAARFPTLGTLNGDYFDTNRLHRRRVRHHRPPDPAAARRPQRHRARVDRSGAAQGPRRTRRDVERRRRRHPLLAGRRGTRGRRPDQKQQDAGDRRLDGASHRQGLDLRLPRDGHRATRRDRRIGTRLQSGLLCDRRDCVAAAARRARPPAHIAGR